jgi:Flp pilus assembly protein TadD
MSAPAGEPYDWYTRGLELLQSGNPAAAAQLLEHAHRAEPDARNIREALARAHFDARRFPVAVDDFRWLVEADPVDHYARYGLGVSLWRLGDFEAAAEALAVAVALKDNPEYQSALRQVRATIKAKREREV